MKEPCKNVELGAIGSLSLESDWILSNNTFFSTIETVAFSIYFILLQPSYNQSRMPYSVAITAHALLQEINNRVNQVTSKLNVQVKPGIYIFTISTKY